MYIYKWYNYVQFFFFFLTNKCCGNFIPFFTVANILNLNFFETNGNEIDIAFVLFVFKIIQLITL